LLDLLDLITFPFSWLRHRGLCLLIGCKIHYSSSSYLPDGCYEWYCERCDADGINSQGANRIADGLIEYLRRWWPRPRKRIKNWFIK
jgi:hypothetical protein